MSARHPRVRFGSLWVDCVSAVQAVDDVEVLVDRARGGLVFTPNVDHVVKAERALEMREAYAAADLCLADGMPLVWASRLLGRALPERVAGSDFALPLLQRAAARGWRVFLLGGGAGVAEAAAARIAESPGAVVAGFAAPEIDLARPTASEARALAQLSAAKADLLLVGLGAPKQEIWLHRHRAALGATVGLGCGATLDFLAGTRRRAPGWVAKAGAEWIFRLLHEPARLGRRYLLEDPEFAAVLWKTLQLPLAERVRLPPAADRGVV